MPVIVYLKIKSFLHFTQNVVKCIKQNGIGTVNLFRASEDGSSRSQPSCQYFTWHFTRLPVAQRIYHSLIFINLDCGCSMMGGQDRFDCVLTMIYSYNSK